MQLDIVYYKNKGLLRYLFLNQVTGVGVFLKSSDSVFCLFGSSVKNVKQYIFDKYFEITEVQTFHVDYDAYVKAAQSTMLKAGLEYQNLSLAEITGSKQVYLVLLEALKHDTDYTHVKQLSSKEIDELTPKKIKKYFSSILGGLTP